MPTRIGFRVVLFVGVFSFAFPLGASTDPTALWMCKQAADLENLCLSVIKGASFMPETLKVCDDLKSQSAKVRCLQIVSNDTFELPLLKACDEERSDWDVVDCLKKMGNKTAAQLNFRITRPLGASIWVKNYSRASYAWDAITQQVNNHARAGYCSGYRYLLPVDPNWKYSDCWSTTFDFADDGGAPDRTAGAQYPVGSAVYTHCTPAYQCVTE